MFIVWIIGVFLTFSFLIINLIFTASKDIDINNSTDILAFIISFFINCFLSLVWPFSLLMFVVLCVVHDLQNKRKLDN